MADDRPPYVNFYPSDWKAGTAHLPPLLEWTYLQICLFNWDKGQNMPAREAPLHLGRNPNWEADLAELVQLGKVGTTAGGNYFVPRAMREAERSKIAYLAKSQGGKAGAKKRWGKAARSEAGTRIVDAWNVMAQEYDLPLVMKLTPKREVHLRERIKDYDEQQIIAAIAKVPSRPFLMGKGNRGWKANFDWLLRPDSVAKVLEGQYGDGISGGLFGAFASE